MATYYSSTSSGFKTSKNFFKPRKEHSVLFTAIDKEQWAKVQQLYETFKDQNPRNRVGAAPIHAIFLAGHRAAGKAFLEKNPECLNLQYEGDRFYGENLLHMAIVQRDFDLVEWLLDRDPQLLNAEATGELFNPAGDAYLGGYPLLFAVASDQPLIVQRIFDVKLNQTKGEDGVKLKNYLHLQDRLGNTALHLAVIHDLPYMYDYILAAEANTEHSTPSDYEDPLHYVINNDKLTPLALAAAMGKVSMFQYILSKNVKKHWDWGPISCNLVPLRGLEQPIILKRPTFTMPGTVSPRSPRLFCSADSTEMLQLSDAKLALNCICSPASVQLSKCLRMKSGKVLPHVQKGRLQILMLDDVKQLLEQKWEAFGRARFHQKFGVVLGTQILWSISAVIPYHYRTDHSTLSAYPLPNAFIIICEALVLSLILWRGTREVYQRLNKGSKGTALVSPTSQTNDFLALTFSICYILAGCFRIVQWFMLEDIFAAFAAVTGWGHVLFFLIGFRSVGPFIIMIKEMVFYDLKRFGMVYITVLLCFTMAMHQVVHPKEVSPVLNFFLHMQRLLLLGILGESPFTAYSQAQSYWLAIALAIVYIVLVVILLLNLLIAMMGNTYNEIASDADRRWYAERSNMIQAFEDEIPIEKMHIIRQRYAFPLETSADLELQPLEVDLYLKVTFLQSWSWRLEVPEREERRAIRSQEDKEFKMLLRLAFWHASPLRFKGPRRQSFADIVAAVQERRRSQCQRSSATLEVPNPDI